MFAEYIYDIHGDSPGPPSHTGSDESYRKCLRRWAGLHLRQSCSSGIRWITGICCSASWCLKQWLVKRWKQTPEATRPALPFLCSALARDTHESSRLSMLLLASYLETGGGRERAGWAPWGKKSNGMKREG